MGKFGRRLEKFELLISLIVFLIPFILPFTSDTLLDSISSYAYSEHSQIYVFLLTVGFFLYVVDGVKYGNNLNLLTALFLLGVILFPSVDFVWLHNISAGLFFLMNVFNLIYYSTKKEKLVSYMVGLLTLLSFTFVFFIPLFSLYVGESVALLLITGRYLYNKFRLRRRLLQ